MKIYKEENRKALQDFKAILSSLEYNNLFWIMENTFREIKRRDNLKYKDGEDNERSN